MVLRQHRKDLEDLWDQVGQGDPVGETKRQMRLY